MDLSEIEKHLKAYKDHAQLIDALEMILDVFELENPNFEQFNVQSTADKKNLILTAEGILEGKQTITIPSNLLDFDLKLVINMLAHEMLHVEQKSSVSLVLDKNEREWQAYYEMLFHERFPKVPNASNFYRIQFAKKALEYYKRMGIDSLLQLQYKDQKFKVEQLLLSMSTKESGKEVTSNSPLPNEPSNLPPKEESPDQKHIWDDEP